MFDAFKQYPLLAAGLAVLILVTVFVWFKAISASKKRAEEREKAIADIEKEKALRNEFRHVDETTFAEGKDDYRLIIGMCAHIQLFLEKAENMTLAFSAISDVKKYIYALGYVFEDSKNGLSDFFRSNGEPLLSASNEAVQALIGGEFSEIFAKEYVMLDENDETTSVDNEALRVMDEKFKDILDNQGAEIYSAVAKYIRENKDEFLTY